MRTLHRLGLLLVLTLAAATAAFAQTVTSVVDMDQELLPGQRGNAIFTLQLDDPDGTVPQGVWFLNIVEPLGGGQVRQVSHLLFEQANESGDGFRRVFSHEHLSNGFSTELEFRISASAPPGRYLVALQLYRGTVTNPSRVRADDRVWMEFHPLVVAAPDQAAADGAP